MRLKRLALPEYKGLRGLEIEFDDKPMGTGNYCFTLLVGNNGTGKSTVLHALADLFRQLSRGSRVSFSFVISYHIERETKPYDVTISGTGPETAVSFIVNGNDHPWDDRLLPDRVVCYSTGRPSAWEPEFLSAPIAADAPPPDRDRAYLLEQPYLPPPGEVVPERIDRVLAIRPDRLALMALCGALVAAAQPAGKGEQNPLEAVFEEIRLRQITGFTMRLNVEEETFASTWRPHLEKLEALADSFQRHGSELFLLFDLRQDLAGKAAKLVGIFGSDRLSLYAMLDRWMDPRDGDRPPLEELSVFVQRGSRPRRKPGSIASEARGPGAGVHLFDWLSDGEQSFIGRMALLYLVGTNRSLILVDEPEVHFNDFWKRQIVRILHASLTDCHVVMATHSSVAVTDVHARQVRILRRGQPLKTEVIPPPIETYAADPSDIMVHLFDAPYPTGAHSQEQLAELLQDLLDPRNAEARSRAKNLLEGMAPGYWSYRLRQALDAGRQET
jgi:ABC-type transport system involved in cytochrome c biogenesis ATPase subunit